MSLAPGTRIGPYEITAAIGAGGMGEVYRALDTTLDRDVAIKVLPELLASDSERVARFSREAKTLASLNHQNIAHIHGVVDPPLALVMEFVDGEDLAQRLARGAIPLDEAIPIAKQIADALECAHEQNIVHRDLKPANVKVRPDGTVKVLDFGLAKALSAQPDGASSSSAVVLSPTFTSPAMTQMGIILGTAAYMAPEQARGKAIDKRADVWAFGVVLFEMLSGTRAFEGSEVSDTLARVLLKEPEWSALPADTPLPIRRLLRRCLHKDRKHRLADIADARIELDDALSTPAAESSATMVPAPPRSRWRALGLVAALGAAVVVGGAAALRFLTPAPPQPAITRFAISPPESVDFSNTGRHFMSLDREGARLVFSAGSQLYVRRLASLTSEPVPGTALTAGVVNPVFSPNGQSIAFYTERTLRRVPVGGGTPFTLATDFLNPQGMCWTESGIYAAQTGVGIVRVPEAGGKPQVVATVGQGEAAASPQMLADGETLVFTIYSGTGQQRFDKGKIVAHSLRTGQRTVLHDGGGDGQVLPTGHLVFGVGGVMYGMKLDLKTLAPRGQPTPILEGVRRSPATGAMMFRVAPNGTLVYAPGTTMTSGTPRSLGLLDRSGQLVALKMPDAPYETPRFSPNGKQIAVVIGTETDSDIWIQDYPVKTALRRLTFGGRNRLPVWSPESTQIAFQSNRDGADDGVYLQPADVSGAAAERLVKLDGWSLIPTSWSRDGWLAVTQQRPNQSALNVFSLKDRKLVPFGTQVAGFNQFGGVFHPEGHWLVYQESGPSGPPQVFIAPFPATGAKYQIDAGFHPLWAPDGKQVVLNTQPGFTLYNVTTTPRVQFAQAGRVERGQSVAPPVGARQFDFSRDGQLLVLLTTTEATSTARELYVVLNWFEELKK